MNSNRYDNLHDDMHEYVAKITVIGVGGGGNNAVNRMYKERLEGVELWNANTDSQVLLNSPVKQKIILGERTTKGLGAGADPQLGKEAAEDNIEQIRSVVLESDMVFIAAGMGGGTGTGAAPVIAKVCKDLNILTIGIVTRPFNFEGRKRSANALEGIQELRKHVDSLIVVSNEQLLQISGNAPMNEAFQEADRVLYQAVRTITDLIIHSSLINLDFADIKTVMKNKGTALIGLGQAKGEDRAFESASRAVSSPLLEASIKGAKNAIVNVSGANVSLMEAHRAVEIIREASGHLEMNVIFGTTIDESLDDIMHVSLIATEFEGSDIYRPAISPDDGSYPGSGGSIEPFDVTNAINKPIEIKKQVEVTTNNEQTFDDYGNDDDFLPGFLRPRGKKNGR